MIDLLKIKAIVKGLMTFLPGFIFVQKRIKKKSTHSCSNAEFCYSLWLSILVFMMKSKTVPRLDKIGELGNGGSFGVGICALLTGSKKYYALSLDEDFSIAQNLRLLDEIVVLLKNKTPISVYSQLNIKLDDYRYPECAINPLYLHDDLVEDIRGEIQRKFVNSKRIMFVNNWSYNNALTLDFIFSRAVLEHVKDPADVYKSIFFHLNNNGMMLNDIEFHSHGITKNTLGHLSLSNLTWRVIYGNRPFFLNRWTLDDHSSCICNIGFNIIELHKTFCNIEPAGYRMIYGAVIYCSKLRN